MDKKKKIGFLNLAKNSFAVITASLSALIGSQSKAASILPHFDSDNKGLSYENFQKNALKPKFVLRLSINNPEKGFLSMHTSHSSHSSHASHASHASHMSSSPTYPHPVISTPVYTPTTPSSSPSGPSSTSKSTTLTFGSRTLFKGCKGNDVIELQQKLLKLGYDITVTGYFGDITESIVMKFQTTNHLSSDGKVDYATFLLLSK